MAMIGTLEFNTKANRAKVYNHLRNCSILSETRNVSRGNYHLRVHVPVNRTWPGIVQQLFADGYSFLNLSAENE